MHSSKHPQNGGFYVETKKTITIKSLHYDSINASIIDGKTEVTSTYVEEITLRYVDCGSEKGSKLNTTLSIIASLLTIGSVIIGMLIASGYTILNT